MTEARLQAQCFQWHWNNYHNSRGMLFMVHNNPLNAIDGNRLKAQGMVAGVSDMLLLRQDKPPLCIEIKLPKCKQQANQIAWQEVAESTGAKYVVVRSLEEFQNAIESCR
jgi:hypothetical protein